MHADRVREGQATRSSCVLTMHSCRCVRETAAYTQTYVAQAAARHATTRACRSPAWIRAPSRALQREWPVARRRFVVSTRHARRSHCQDPPKNTPSVPHRVRLAPKHALRLEGKRSKGQRLKSIPLLYCTVYSPLPHGTSRLSRFRFGQSVPTPFQCGIKF